MSDTPAPRRHGLSSTTALVATVIGASIATAIGFMITLALAFEWSDSSAPPADWIQLGWGFVGLLTLPIITTIGLAAVSPPRDQRRNIVGLVIAVVPKRLYFLMGSLLFH